MKIQKIIILMLIMGLILSACGGDKPAAESPTTAPTDVSPTSTSVPPTNTPMPPTATIAPTETSPPAPTEEPATPTAEPIVEAPVGDTVHYENEVLGIAFDHPADWEIADIFNIFLMASTAEAISSLDETGGSEPPDAPIVVIAAELSEGQDVLAILESNLPDEGTEVTYIEEPNITTLNDREVAQLVVEISEDDGEVSYARFMTTIEGEYAYIIFFVSPIDQTDENIPILDAIANSMIFLGVDEEAMGGDIFGTNENDTAVDGGKLSLNSVVLGTLTQSVTYSFTTTADTSYLFYAIGPEADLELALADESGGTILAVDDGFTNEDEVVLWVAPTAGIYTITVSEFGFGEGDREFALAFYEAMPALDSIPEISIDNDSVVLIYVEPIDEFDPKLLVQDDAGIILQEKDDNGDSAAEYAIVTNLPTGNYTLKVDAFASDDIGSYQSVVIYADPIFALSQLPNDLTEEDPIQVNTVISGVVNQAIYLIEVEDGKPYLLAAKSLEPTDLAMRVYAAQGSYDTTVDNLFDAGIEANVFQLNDGQYVVEIEDFSDSSEPFTLAFYEIELTDSDSLEITITDETIPYVIVQPSGEEDVILTVTDGDGNEVLSVDSGFSGEIEGVLLTDLPAGIYTVTGRLFGGEEGAFKFGVAYLDPAFVIE